jgi:cytochrome c biogenesis protein CcmG, thiol:disulfide interchange protein DsbE
MNRAAIALVTIVALYFGVRLVVREYVDHEIEKNQGETLPTFALKSLDGATFTNADIAGKIAILHFSRSFCGSCEKEKPAVKEFEKTLDPSQIVLVTLNTDPVMGFTLDDTKKTVERSGFAHPTYLVDEKFLNDFHGAAWAKVTPITYFVDRQGKIVTSLRGTQTVESLSAALESVAVK